MSEVTKPPSFANNNNKDISFANLNNCNYVVSSFKSFISDETAVPVAAMNSLIVMINKSNATTWMQLEHELRGAIILLKQCSREDLGGRTNISLGTGCELFMKYVSKAFNDEIMEFNVCKDELLKRGERFAGMSLSARAQIAEIGHSFVQDDFTVLIHGRSRVVESLLLRAARSKQFSVIVTEGRPHEDGLSLARAYQQVGIPTRVIHDSAVGFIMEQVDMCLVGAEGVMENGGVVNKVGTYQIAMVAKALARPFYVAVESYKFARMYPLTQRDLLDASLQDLSSAPAGCLVDTASSPEQTIDTPTTIDFTPSEYISLLFTDLGILTPAAVSDELIRLYQ